MKGIIVKSIVMAGTSLGALALFGGAYAQMGMMGGPGMMGGQGMMGGPGMMGMATLRHQYVSQYGLEAKYADKRNPLRSTRKNLAAGKRLYEASCASCHGASGLGDGPAAQALNPPPANIAATSQMPMATDGYLYWTIAEGGAALHSAMPAFKDTLKPDAIWQIILYLRRL
jgi:mono/diheme cytochrome c family protein